MAKGDAWPVARTPAGKDTHPPSLQAPLPQEKPHDPPAIGPPEPHAPEKNASKTVIVQDEQESMSPTWLWYPPKSVRALAAAVLGLWVIGCKPAQGPEPRELATSASAPSDRPTRSGGNVTGERNVTADALDAGDLVAEGPTDADTGSATPPHGAACSAARSSFAASRPGWVPAPRKREPWVPGDPARWQSALTGFSSTMTLDRRLPIGPVAVPFARYLMGMHFRIHPVFADWFLVSLKDLPATDPMNQGDLLTGLEMIIDKNGRLAKIGVVITSGLPAFDIAALEAVDRAQPFGPPPSEIVSADGNVHVQWKFYRDERCGCSTIGVYPALVR
jgi:TonB family protein